MRVTITERHCEVPKRVLDRTESQVAGLAKFEQRASHAEVIYSEEKRSMKIEIVVFVDGAPEVAARGEGGDFRKALDQGVERMRRQLREQRERRRDHQAPPLSESLTADISEEPADE